MMNDDIPLIQTQQLVKVYGSGENRVVALAGIDLIIQSGEFVAIMGPSGSGKSTLLNILACLDRPSEGKYVLAGEDVSGYNRAQLAEIRGQQLGFVFQSYNLLPRLTALENVLLPLLYRRDGRLSHTERQEKAMAALASVGLADRSHHYPNQLSGGQQQRVAIARAVAGNPDLVLADEPTGNLDSRSAARVADLFTEINRQGRTLVVVSHDPALVERAVRVLPMRDGSIAAGT
ncbi:MAG TPA: macrolide ABC transporter ATP-binding protein [Anaerolineaceae bacterium]|nr:macrolide ABC transporter ATP-binding protein [Anaerolineaceae bacterium]